MQKTQKVQLCEMHLDWEQMEQIDDEYNNCI